MITELLVPLDGSKSAENALPIAAALSTAYELPVRLLAVLDESFDRTGVYDEQTAQVFVGYARQRAEHYGLAEERLAIEAVGGNAADEILLRGAAAGMVVLATHGRGGFRAGIVGSIADRVVRCAHVPVLAVPAIGPPRGFAPGPILATTDGSLNAERALPLAREAAGNLAKELVLLRTFSLVPVAAADVPVYLPEYAEVLESNTRGELASLALKGERVLVKCGSPITTIVETAASLDAALIVMASSGKGMAKRLVFGSTTLGVLHSGLRPLLIVPPPVRA